MATAPQPPHPPRATYRVQLHAQFGFAEAAALTDYLAELGISHLYCSPYLQAAKGSTHGYDVVDYGRVNEELGGAAGHNTLFQALQRNHLGQVLDIVPNHMSISQPDNVWWWDVLENGPASRYASYFDVDWHPPDAKMRNMILLPILEDHYGRVLEAGHFQLLRRGGSFLLRYRDHLVPLSPRTIDGVLRRAGEKYTSDQLMFLADSFGRLPHSAATDFRSVRLRHRDQEVLRELLSRLCQQDVGAAATIDSVLTEITFDHDALDSLLDRQNYRLAFWRTARDELDYRRFFDVTSLASLRTEDEQVFADIHELPLRWVREGLLDGLRVDHPDGLRDPDQYFERLREQAPSAWIVAEKILTPGERLPAHWPIAGTTGYDFVNLVGGLFVHPDGEEPLTKFYAEFTGAAVDYRALVREKKHLVLRELFSAEVARLAAVLGDICEKNRRYRDYTRRELISVVRETIACFPVYRTYVQAEATMVEEQDQQFILAAIEAARANRPDLDGALFDFLQDILLLRVRGEEESEFVMRFQQQTGPVTAKGVEDTAFYCFNRLVSLNEVGGDPGRFGTSLADFHHACQQAQHDWPHSMLASTTHDTKRSEDVRLRISLLSETPDQWSETVRTWSRLNEKHRRDDMPDRNLEYLIYQTLVGAWPIDAARLVAYVEKAAREAKEHTSWTAQNEPYETAARDFAKGILADESFCARVQNFVAPLLEAAWTHSLSLTLIKLTAPGVPDIYQGTELWDLSLVDPDNRRPVDYVRRRDMLGELNSLKPAQIWARAAEGLPKLWVIRQTLAARSRLVETFETGEYRPIEASGAKAAHVVAFARSEGAVTVAPRWLLRLGGQWGDTALTMPAGKWRHELAGGEETISGKVSVRELLSRFPVALLTRVAE